jgi:hypothetical protein
MKYKEILKLLFFSIATAAVARYIGIYIIWESMKFTKNDFHKNLINITTYQQEIAEKFYLELVIMFVLPYVAAILFYFFAKINLRPKYNFLIFIIIFTTLYFLSFLLISYICKFFK